MQFEEEIKADEEQEVEEEAEEMKKPKRPKSTGLLFTIFGALVIVLVGGLASYYYYTFQREGYLGDKAIRDAWESTVKASSKLNSKFSGVDNWPGLTAGGDDSFASLVGETNRIVRNNLFDVRSQTGLDLKTSTTVSKMTQFMEDYGTMLGEIKKVLDRVDEANDPKVFDAAKAAAKEADSSYDELLQLRSPLARMAFPQDVFDLPSDLANLLAKQIAEHGTTEEQDKSTKDAAESVVTQFVSAWQNRNGDTMKSYLTPGAKSEFNGAILEDSVDIVGFKITETTLSDDKTRVTVMGDLSKEAPGGTRTTEKWSFTLLSQDGKWLIDSWKSVS